MWKERLDLAGAVARAAGQGVLPMWQTDTLQVRTKRDVTDLVSAADLAAEKICETMLRGAEPADGIVSEEGLQVPSRNGFQWGIDPVDGTSNFVHGLGHWATVISGWQDGRAVLGAVYDPVRDELFCAAEDTGMTCNGALIGPRPPRALEASMWATGFTAAPDHSRSASFADVVLSRVGHVRAMGSLGLDLAWTAAGRFDAFLYECSLDPWVHGAGTVMCTQQGMRMVALPETDRFASALAAVPGHWSDLLG